MKFHPLKFLWRVVYSIYFYAAFFVFSNCFYWYGVVRGLTSHEEWRMLGLKALDVIFACICIRVDVRGREHIPDEPVIFCANHQSFLDGLIVFYIIRRPFTAITAPYHIFPGNLAHWFLRMGYISIGRDLFEELRYKGTLEHSKSVHEGVKILQRGESLLIFPEGKREFQKRLLPFHGGVVKIAHDAKVPIMPITITGLDTLFPYGSVLLTPVTLGAVIEKPLRLREHGDSLLKETTRLEEIIRTHLPARYCDEHSFPRYPQGKRAAFFDLDGTLTRSNIYQGIIMRYFYRHVTLRTFALLVHLAVKRIVRKHGRFYQDAIRLLKGIAVADLVQNVPALLARNTDTIFYPEMLQLLELHKKEGNLVFIISEEPEGILGPVLHFLHTPGFGTATEIVHGRFNGKVVGHIMKDEVKRDKVIALAHEHNLDLEKSFAYGNSWHDYAMLRTVGHAALVNPERTLKKRGKQLGFKIIRQR